MLSQKQTKINEAVGYLLTALLDTMLENDLLAVGLHAPDPSRRVAGTGSQKVLAGVPSTDEDLGVVTLEYASLKSENFVNEVYFVF